MALLKTFVLFSSILASNHIGSCYPTTAPFYIRQTNSGPLGIFGNFLQSLGSFLPFSYSRPSSLSQPQATPERWQYPDMTNPGLRVYGVSAGPHYPSYLYYQGPPNYNVGFSNYGSLRIRPNNPLYSSPYKRPRPRTYNRPSLLRTESEDPDYPLFKTNEHLYHPFFRVDREGRTFGIFKDLFGLFPPPQEQFVEQNGVPEPLWLAEEQGPAIMDSFRLTVPFYPFVRDPPVPNSNRLGSLNEAVNAMPATELEQVVHRIIASMDSANNNNAFYPNRGRYYFY